MRLASICALLSLLTTLTCARAQEINYDLGPDKAYNSEPFLAVQPGQPQNICVAWMRMNNLRIGIAVRTSHDGGNTWSPVIELPHMGRTWHSADVSMAWKPGGDLYLSYIDYRETPDSGGVYVVHSSDGGEHWTDPVKAIDGFTNADEPIDRPWIAVDPYSKSLFPKVYLVSKPPSWNPLPNHAYFTRSMDGGKTWDTLRVLDAPPFGAGLIPAPMASPTVGSDGTLYITVPCYDLSQAVNVGLALATSHDGGQTFERRLTHRATTPADTAYKNGYRLVADLSDPNHLILGMSSAAAGNNDATVSTSFDGGVTWTNPIRVNDDSGNAGQDMVWPVVATNGTAALLWRDRRNANSDSAHVATDTYYSFSRDGGKTWAKNIRVSDSTAPFIPILAGPGNDFLSGALENDTLYAAWADSRTGNLRVYFAKLGVGDRAWVGMQDLEATTPSLSIAGRDGTSTSVAILVEPGCSYEVGVYDVGGRLLDRVTGVSTDGTANVRLKTRQEPVLISLTTPHGKHTLKLTP